MAFEKISNMDSNIDNNTEKKRQEILTKLFPEKLMSPEEIENKYPRRGLDEGEMVTRFAPSPTGSMHIGGVYAAMISEKLARQSNGVFYLRIEDTDKKREVDGASDLIVDSLDRYGIKIDEGVSFGGSEKGEYGPYKQSERKDIYHTFIKKLLEQGLAYPCFCSTEELDKLRQSQEDQGVRKGYYKQWAKWRNKSEEEVLQALNQGNNFVIRFKSSGDFNNKIEIKDLLLGNRDMSENDQDIVIMKSDGLPTYHMAHVVDDYLMGTTQVIRGNEWLPSLPLHLQMFDALGWDPPEYGHIFPIQKMEDNSRRKLSKRKDPEASVSFYDEKGYPEKAVIDYLMNLANSNYEDWRKENPSLTSKEFNISFKKLASSNGPLFDFDKLDDISRNTIAEMSAEEVCANVLKWSKKYDQELSYLIQDNHDYTNKIFAIERSNTNKVRKDITKWSDVKEEIIFFFDDKFNIQDNILKKLVSEAHVEDVGAVLADFLESYNPADSNESWFNKIKEIAVKNGYSDNIKDYKKTPEKFKGSISDVAQIIRVTLTGRSKTPDLYSVMKVMGTERINDRLGAYRYL